MGTLNIIDLIIILDKCGNVTYHIYRIIKHKTWSLIFKRYNHSKYENL